MMELEARSPTRSIQEVQQETRQVDAAVTEKKEHGDDGSDEIQVSKDHTASTDQHGEERGQMWLRIVR